MVESAADVVGVVVVVEAWLDIDNRSFSPIFGKSFATDVQCCEGVSNMQTTTENHNVAEL